MNVSVLFIPVRWDNCKQKHKSQRTYSRDIRVIQPTKNQHREIVMIASAAMPQMAAVI